MILNAAMQSVEGDIRCVRTIRSCLFYSATEAAMISSFRVNEHISGPHLPKARAAQDIDPVPQTDQLATASDFFGSWNGIGTTVPPRVSPSLSTVNCVPISVCSTLSIPSAMFFSSLGE